jgi:hypothetical protein
MKLTLKQFVRNTFVIIGVVLAVLIILPIVVLVWWLDQK